MSVALDTALGSVAALGGSIGDVILTPMYVVRADADAVGRVHAERFDAVHPAATMVLVAGLINEEMPVEVQVEAQVGSAKPRTRDGRRS